MGERLLCSPLIAFGQGSWWRREVPRPWRTMISGNWRRGNSTSHGVEGQWVMTRYGLPLGVHRLAETTSVYIQWALIGIVLVFIMCCFFNARHVTGTEVVIDTLSVPFIASAQFLIGCSIHERQFSCVRSWYGRWKRSPVPIPESAFQCSYTHAFGSLWYGKTSRWYIYIHISLTDYQAPFRKIENPLKGSRCLCAWLISVLPSRKCINNAVKLIHF